MYTHIAKDGSIVKLPNQAKNAIDSTIQKNADTKKKIKLERNDMIGEQVDRSLCEIRGSAISIGKLPRKK